ncbi:MAG: transposase [Desulfobulbaceae bacterium]|nr:transposase [Desulfobulbaceae bacterium]
MWKRADRFRRAEGRCPSVPVRLAGTTQRRKIIKPTNHLPDSQQQTTNLRRGDPCDRPSSDYRPSLIEHPKGTLPDTLGRIVQAFKSISTNKYINGVKQNGWPPFPNKLWQRNYWDHVIRHETELNIIREYIRANPTQWKTDKLYTPARVDGAPVNNLHETMEPDTEYIHKPWMV